MFSYLVLFGYVKGEIKQSQSNFKKKICLFRPCVLYYHIEYVCAERGLDGSITLNLERVFSDSMCVDGVPVCIIMYPCPQF